MSNKPFFYQNPFPLAHDDTEYYLLTKEHVSVAEFDGQEVLKVEPEALTLLAQQAFHDAAFMLRTSHQKQVAAILSDPEASENDKYVALQFLRNSDIAAKGILPTCQDTGTAIITGKKGQRVWTGGGDEAALARGVYNTYTEDNLRYSQNAALDMYKEVNTGTNLPAQIDLYSVRTTPSIPQAWRYSITMVCRVRFIGYSGSGNVCGARCWSMISVSCLRAIAMVISCCCVMWWFLIRSFPVKKHSSSVFASSIIYT